MNDAIAAAAIPRHDQSAADGIHVLWNPPATVGYSLHGWDILRRNASGRPKVQCRVLTSAEMTALHRALRLRLPVGELRVQRVDCPTLTPVTTRFPASMRAATATAPERRCVAYTLRLPEPHRFVQVRAGVPAALAIALRAGKAIEVRQLDDSSGTQTATFTNRAVDEVQLHCPARASSLEICLDVVADPAADEAAWSGATVVAKNLEMPLRSVNAAIGSPAQELALASSRLLAGEQLDADAFSDAAELMNAAAKDNAHMPPVLTSTATRDDVDDPFLDVRSWSFALALLADPAWRRALGFAVLDRAAGLTPGQAYDYRITGRFRRRDVEERVHGFHAVPRETTLPSVFQLGDITLRTPEPAVVQQFPAPAAGALTDTGRKGIAVAGNACLSITFSAPVKSIVLEVEPTSNLSYTARTTGFIPSLPLHHFGGAVPAQHRVRLDFADPVDTVTFAGDGVLYAVREVLSPPGADPDEVVTRSAVLYDVAFVDTPVPPPPSTLTTANLQQPVVGGTSSTVNPPAALGFALTWDPPPAGSAGPVPWPPNANIPPPSEAMGFELERRRVDTNGAFGALDPAVGPVRIFGSRGGIEDAPVLRPGIDLESAFPEGMPAQGPVHPHITYEDVLVDNHNAGPPPGSLHQYRVYSVDAIGRRSAAARTGSVARLEKHRAPPQPAGPPEDAALPLAQSGVRARVLQATDSDLGAADRALLGTSTNAVVLEWGWTQGERDADPHAREFRVYWQPLPPDVVHGVVRGPPTLTGGAFEMSVTLDRPLPADAMRGRYLRLPDYPFKVVSHPAGQTIVVRFEPSVVQPQTVPADAAITFRPVLDGSESSPIAWAERTAVVPITAAESYRHVFRNRLMLTAEEPRARIWAGVSSADDQPYVDDALDGSVGNGGRPGNESAVVAAEATARYLGRPDFVIPPPLPDVPETVTDEPVGDSVLIALDLPTLLPTVSIPAGHVLQLERLSLDDVLGCMRANNDGTAGASLPDHTTTSYTLGNPTDQADLLGQLRTGTPALVENRFLMEFVVRFADALEILWAPTLLTRIPLSIVDDVLPAKASRYVHRVRLVDAAGHVSAGGAIAPQVVRVASLRSPSPPEVTTTPSPGGVSLQVRIRDAPDVRWVMVFHMEQPATTAVGSLGAAAQLLRMPNSRDRLPQTGLRLRLPDGTLLAPTLALDAGDGAVEPPDRILTSTLGATDHQVVTLWAVTVTRDGIPSRFSGPTVAIASPPALTAPTLAVTRSGNTDAVQWISPTSSALLAIERSIDDGASWQQVSPWLPATVSGYTLESTSGIVWYRAAVHADRGRSATGDVAVV